MKQRIILGSNLISGLLILDQLGVWNTFVMFILVGQIPGTSYSLSALTMLVLFILVGIATLTMLMLRAGHRANRPTVLPKRRYSRL